MNHLTKKTKEKHKVYCTHAGFFHCDEVTGFAITKLAGICIDFKRLKETNDIQPDKENILIADIGRKYDPENLMFDHHQGKLFRNNGYPYASAGLLWKEYGMIIINNAFPDFSFPDFIFRRVDEMLIQGIDAHDSDNAYQVDSNCIGGPVRVKTLPMLVSSMNYHDYNNHLMQNVTFIAAVNFVESMLRIEINKAFQYYIDTILFDSKIEILSQRIALLEDDIQWREQLHQKFPKILFLIKPSMHPGSKFSLHAVTTKPDNRIVKKKIERPNWFKGFIHEGKWIAGHNKVEELVRLARYNVKQIENRIISDFNKT